MSINKDYTMIIDKGKSKLNEALEIYTSDLGVSIYINILDSPYLKLSNHEDLYAKFILKDGLGKKITSNVVPVVNNTVIFNLDKRIMGSMTESGKYSVYIIIMDDKQNKKVLPPVTMTVIESDLVLGDLETSVIGSSVNNTAIQSYGNELLIFNVDGSYNRTIWVTGDVITTAKMNKIEKAISKMKDSLNEAERKLATFDDTQVHQVLDGGTSPIILSNLEKGFYTISGRYMNFEGESNDDTLPEGENYFIVTYSDATTCKVLRCLSNENEFKKYKYDKNLKQVFDDENVLTVITPQKADDENVWYANINEDKHQYLHISSGITGSVEMQLPINVDTFADITLYLLVDGSNTISLPTDMKWNITPVIETGRMLKLNLVYIDGLWYGFWEGGND